MRRQRPPGSPSPYRALAHHQQAKSPTGSSDPSSLIRSFDVESNPARPVRPSPLAASAIRDMPLDLVQRIRSFPLFQAASEAFLVAVGNQLKPQVHGPNDLIVTEGDEARAMYWLVRGVVAVTSRDGEAVFAELKSGSFFGEIGVLMNVPRTATIVARTKCLLLVLKKEHLQLIMPQFPDMQKAIMEEAQERLSLLKKKKRNEGASVATSPLHQDHDASPRPPMAAPGAGGDRSAGESGAFRDGAAVNSRKRKSPSPGGVIDSPATGSAIGSGFVNVRNTLKELPLFSTLPPDVLHFLGLSVQPRTYPPFTDIIRQGSPGNDIFFIVQGEAEVIHQPADARQPASSAQGPIQMRPRLRSGQYFGEVASLGLSPGRTATVKSITTVECLIVPGDVLNELWRRSPPSVRSQVEKTARTRLQRPGDEVRNETDVTDQILPPLSNESAATTTTTTTAKTATAKGASAHRTSCPDLAYTTFAKPASPAQDDRERMNPKDPDPFLSVDMESLRNRRRHSLAPPTPQSESSSSSSSSRSSTTPGRRKGTSISLLDSTPIPFAIATPPPDARVRSKRAKTLLRPQAPQFLPILPDAVLVRIFRHLDIGALIRLRIVSKHWRRLLTTSPDVCRHVDLSRYNRKVSDDIIIRVLAPFISTRAVTMDLNNCFHISDTGFSALWRSCAENVRQWRMRSVWDVSANQILEMSEHARNLEEVDWSNCRKVGDNLLGRVVGWIVPKLPAAAAEHRTAVGAVGHTRHQRVGLSAKQAEVKHGSAAPGTVVGCPRLSKLDLSYCKHVTDRSMAHLAAHACGRLRSLSLTRCTSITDSGFESWAAYKFEKLTHLCLADCTYLSDRAIVALVNAAKNLTHLDLSFCCALTDTSTSVVAMGLPKLLELRLAFCGSAVSDSSLEAIALHLGELEGLSVRGCVRVTSHGLETIVRGCPRLRWVDVSQCRNLKGWSRSGHLARWGFDDRAPAKHAGYRDVFTLEDKENAAASDDGPKTMSAAVLAPLPIFLPSRTGYEQLDRQHEWRRPPVRFIMEKGVDGLR